jgi:sugar lactone lactonase YvrE
LFFGVVDHQAILQRKPFGPSAFYRLDTEGHVALIRDGLKFANGIGLSLNGRHLYHNDSSVGTYVYEVSPDGSVGTGTLLSKQQDCDGLAVDCEGGVWIAGVSSGTITRVMPDGTVDQRVPVPGGHVTSLCFGGPDGRDLYVTTAAPGAGEAVLERRIPESRAAALYHARSEVPGVPVGQTRFAVAARQRPR